MAPKKNNAPAGFVPNAEQINLLKEIDAATKAGNIRYVSKAEAGDLFVNKLITVDPKNLDANENAAAALTEAGSKELANVTETNTTETNANTGTEAVATPAVVFAIANVAPPAVERKPPVNTKPREPKYPLHTLGLGQAIFIPATKNEDGTYPAATKLSKSFGSLVSNFNKAAIDAAAKGTGEDKYVTSRGLADGYEAGFRPEGDEERYKGVPGTGIYRRPLEERKERAPRKPRGSAATTNAA